MTEMNADEFSSHPEAGSPPPLPPSAETVPSFPPIAGERWGRIVAAAIIVMLVGWVLAKTVFPEPKPAKEKGAKSQVNAQEELSAKYLFGLAGKLPETERNKLLKEMTQGKGPQRAMQPLRAFVLQTALREELLTEASVAASGLSKAEQLPLSILAKGEQLSPEDAVEFKKTHGWFAKLAQSLSEKSDESLKAEVLADGTRCVLIMVGFGCLLGIAALTGLTLFIVFLTKYRLPRLQKRWNGPPRARGGPFIEAFAIYLAGMVLPDLLEKRFPSLPWQFSIVCGLAGMLLAIFWPRLRGMSRPEWRWGLGLNLGKGFFKEASCGVLGWLTGLPIIGVCVVISIAIATFSGQQMDHPINEMIGKEGSGLWVILLAAVYAPISEELCFRGLLLSGLRSRASFWIAVLSTAFIFAALHPQGWAAIPVLGAIAVVFGWIRAWRGSIIGPMTAHALHNGLICTLILAI